MKMLVRSCTAAALVAAASSCLFADGDSPVAPTVIYETAPTGESGNIDGTKMGLAVNLPDGSWSAFGGWHWSQPTMDSAGIYRSNEEKSGLALPLSSAGSYVRPASITIEASIRDNLEKDDPRLGLGFWKESVPRSTQEAGDFNSWSGFYGLRYSPRRHMIRLIIDGTETGAEVSVPAEDISVFHTFTYTIDTSTGGIRDVMCDGKYVLGLPETTEFTTEHTKFGGAASLGSGRLIMKRLTITAGAERAEVPVFAESEDFVGQATALDVSAVGSSSGTDATVTVAPFGDSGAYSIANGTFTWTPAAAGTYELTFTATIGEETAVRHATYTVYAARATIDANTWTNEGDNAFTPAAANLLLGVTGTETSCDSVTLNETQGPIASLTDGMVTEYSTVNGRYD